MSKIGVHIDLSTFTVLLIGKELIHSLLSTQQDNLLKDPAACFNGLALAIIKVRGPEAGIDPNNIPSPEKWSLGTLAKEDLDYLMSFVPLVSLHRLETVDRVTGPAS